MNEYFTSVGKKLSVKIMQPYNRNVQLPPMNQNMFLFIQPIVLKYIK